MKILNAYEKEDKVWGENGYWNKVKWKGKEGYIWKDAVSRSMKKISSTKYKGISYIYGLKSLVVFKNSKPINCITKSYLPYPQKLYTKGTLGLKSNYEFIAAYYSGGSCGKPSGEALFLWDGKKIRYVMDEYAVGDGREGEATTYIFPINLDGEKDKVIHEFYMEYSFDFPHCITKNSGYLSSYLERSVQHLKFELDSFVEIPSKHSRLRTEVNIYKKGYTLAERYFTDLNNDGIEDVIFRANKVYHNSSQGSIVGYAFGTKNGNFKITETTSELTKKSFLANIRVKGNSFFLTFVGNNNNSIQTLEFKIKKEGIAHWKSKETITVSENPNNHRNQICIPKTERFKSQKIKFINAWVNFEED